MLRRLVLAVGIVVAIAYLASRRAGSGEDAPSAHDVRTAAVDALPDRPDEGLSGDARRIPIGRRDSESTIDDPFESVADDPAGENGTGAGETLDDDRSDEELTEMGNEHVDEAPAEPGELTVDEEIVDELVDDDPPAESGGEPSRDAEDDS